MVWAAATAVGTEALRSLVAHFKGKGAFLNAAKIERAIAALGEEYGADDGSKAALALIQEHGLATDEALQLELDLLLPRAFITKGEERKRVSTRVKELVSGLGRHQRT